MTKERGGGDKGIREGIMEGGMKGK